MSTKTRAILAGVLLLALSIMLLPRLARRIDSTLDPLWEEAWAREAEYRAMTNAYPIASEASSDHPVRRLWEERRAALLKAGYIQTCELRMQHPLAARGEVKAFFLAFQSRFPGIECSVRGARSNQPVVVVTARRSDLGPLGAIERFVRQYDPKR